MKDQERDAEIPCASILKLMRETTLKMLSELSSAAKDYDDPELMYAANRAWHELVAREPRGRTH